MEPPRSEDFRGPGRGHWQLPNQVLAALRLEKGNTVADIGAGTGYFSLLFAKAVGPREKVVAVNIDSRALDYLKRQAQNQNLTNIVTVESFPDNPLLANGSIDVAFFCDTVHEIGRRVDYYRKVHRAL